MSSIKLKHSGGNSVIIAAPSSNPASDKTITLPSTESGVFATKDSANSLQNVTGINGGQLANRNKVINGGMMVHQRGDASATNSSDYLSCDRFITNNNSSAQVAVTKSTDTPDGFSASTKWDCTTADTSIAAGDYFIIQHRMEGQNVQDFAKGTSSAKQYALSFYIKATKTGVYTVELEDTDNARVCSKTITVSDTNWNRYSIIYPADTTGAFNNDANSSLTINFWLMVGSNFTSGTLQSSAWGTRTNANRASSSNVNALDSTSNDFLLTGVQLEVGGTVTDFEHRSFGQELALCERYCQILAEGANNYVATAFVYSTSLAIGCLTYRTTMRTIPTLVQTTGTNYYFLAQSGSIHYFSAFDHLSHGGARSGGLATPVLGTTAGQAGGISTVNSAAQIRLEAEL